MKKAIIKEGCIGCGACAAVCPAVFEMNSDYVAEVVCGVDEVNLAAALNAANGCPMQIIEIED